MTEHHLLIYERRVESHSPDYELTGLFVYGAGRMVGRG